MSNKIKFSKKALTDLPLPDKGKRKAYYDTETPSLLVMVTGAGSKTFYVYRKINGTPERIKIGSFPLMTVEQSRKQAAVINGKIADGVNPNEVKREQRSEDTLESLFFDYLERHAKVHNRSWKDDEYTFNKYVEPLKRKKVSLIKKNDIRNLHKYIGENNGKYVANRTLALLRGMFNRGIEWELCQEPNPCRGIKPYKEHQRDRFLQADEIPRFFKAVADEPNEVIKDYILLSLLTGARRTNILEMRWEHISFERAEWRIPMTKGGEPQTVPLVDEALEILRLRREQASESEWVLPSKTSKSGHLQEPKKGWQRILERADIENLRLHDLRRTMGSWQTKVGSSLSVIGKSLGHKSVSTTAIYARLDIDPVRNSMETATRAMLDAAKPTSDT